MRGTRFAQTFLLGYSLAIVVVNLSLKAQKFYYNEIFLNQLHDTIDQSIGQLRQLQEEAASRKPKATDEYIALITLENELRILKTKQFGSAVKVIATQIEILNAFRNPLKGVKNILKMKDAINATNDQL